MNSKLFTLVMLQASLLYAFASADVVGYCMYALLGFYLILKYPIKYITVKIFYILAVYVSFALLFIPVKLLDDLYLLPKLTMGLSSMVLSLYFLNDKYIMYNSVKITVFIYQFIVIFLVVYFGFEDFPSVSPLEKIFEGKSGNGITSYLIVIQIAYFILHTLVSSKGDIHLAISLFLTLGISLTTYARGSLISAVCLIIIYFTLFNRSSLFWVSLLSIFVVCSVLYYESIELFFLRYTKLSQGFSGDERLIAMNEYLRNMDIIGFLGGVDYSDTIIAEKLNNNPHNSFIRAHHNFGIFYVFSNFLLIFVAPVFFSNRSTLHFSILLVLLFRIWTEPILLPTILDLYFFLIVFGLLRHGKEKVYETDLQ